MNQPHPPWGPEDDEFVRSALMSLMDDVSTQPLPEPESIRARAEGSGTLVDLGLERGRRRSLTWLMGAAAAAVIATGAGTYIANQSPDHPVASSSTSDQEETPAASTSRTAGVSRLTMLDTRAWSAVLARPVTSTTVRPAQGEACFEPTEDASWSMTGPVLADGAIPARQWIGIPRSDSTQALTEAVDAARQTCSDLTTLDESQNSLGEDSAYRAWLTQDTDGNRRWWLEVTDGEALSFLTIPVDGDRSWTDDEVRQVARAVLGEVTLTPKTTSTAPTPAETDTATPSSPVATAGSPAPSGTASGTTGDPTPDSSPSSSSPSPSEVEIPQPLADSYYVPASEWATQSVTGGAPAYWGALELEGPPYLSACTSIDEGVQEWGKGVRSGPGDDNYFGRQHVMLTDQADRAYSELIAGYGNGTCPGPAIGGTSTALSSNVFRITQGDYTYYLAVVRMSSDGVSILQLGEAKTAPAPLTDSVALSELNRLAGLAAQR